MPRRIRMFEPEALYFITTRTFQRRFFLTPTKENTEIIGGIIAKGMEKYDVEIFAYAVLTNHMHLICRARPKELSAFMGFVKSTVPLGEAE